MSSFATGSQTRSARTRRKELYNSFSVPGSGAPLFRAAAANLNPRTEAKVDSENPDRGPLLITLVAETALAFVQRFVSPDGTTHADSHAAALA
jgi:hypothetical protein